jgi:uncharacterized membrane protein
MKPPATGMAERRTNGGHAQRQASERAPAWRVSRSPKKPAGCQTDDCVGHEGHHQDEGERQEGNRQQSAEAERGDEIAEPDESQDDRDEHRDESKQQIQSRRRRLDCALVLAHSRAMITGYELVKTIHVLGAIAWVGGAITLNILGTKLRAAGDAPRLTAFARDVEWIGNRIYLPASVIVLVFGVLAVLEGGFGFTTLWVALGLAGIVFTALTGSLFLGPESKRIAQLADSRGVEDPEVQRRIMRLFGLARIDLVVLLLVVVDMVAKPA